MIKIEPLLITNPFEVYPELTTIWPEPSNSVMQEAVNHDLQALAQYPLIDIGGIFLIKLQEKVIGITGYFIDRKDGMFAPWEGNKDLTELYLRWHGILPEYQGKGYSTQALSQVVLEAQKRYPKLQTLIELVPQTHYKAKIEKYFTTFGFTPVGPKERYDWSEYDWQPYHLDTQAYVASFNKEPQQKPKI